MYRKAIIQILAAILIIAAACQSHDPTPVVLVSKEYDNRFAEWLPMAGKSINQVNMYDVDPDSIGFYLNIADGIIITGGPDVNPAIYGKETDTGRCGTIDHRRDTLELEMIRYAMENNIPLLGICRGNQILNVASKGSLIIDIPADHDTIIKHCCRVNHPVRIAEGSMLSAIIGQDAGQVNSSHHQAVENLAPGFRAAAFAPDGIIEAIEFVDRNEHPFVLGIQWHPETLVRESENHPFSLPIVIRFMEEVHKVAH
jgi:putative glutamine amidotransferase